TGIAFRAYPDDATLPIYHSFDLLIGPVHLCKYFNGTIVQLFAHRGQNELLVPAVKQLCANLELSFLQLIAQGTLGQMEDIHGTGYPSFFHNRLYQSQVSDFHFKSLLSKIKPYPGG